MIEPTYFKNKEEWRAWLEKNHDKEIEIAILKYKKHTGKPSLTHQEAMDEAICFGWIDTTIKRLDEDRYIRNFRSRSKNSRWSSNTQKYAKRLIKEKRMAPRGLEFYKQGLKKPTIDAGRSKNPIPPKDLLEELEKHPKAKEAFEKLAPSYRRIHLVMLEHAKRPETRKKRINWTIDRLLAGKKGWQ